jgi:hypothetical protein
MVSNRLPRASREMLRPLAWIWTIILLLAGCAHGVRLSEADRAQLKDASRIHVLPYEASPPRLKTASRTSAQTPVAIRRHAGADPTTLIAGSFVNLLAKKERLRNLHLEKSRPPPVPKSAKDYAHHKWHGLALDMWVDDWTFEEIASQPGHFGMRLTAGARLARIDNGHVLWSTGRCSVGGNGHELRLSKTELTHGPRLRKLLTYTREECARQFVRDFSAAEAQK